MNSKINKNNNFTVIHIAAAIMVIVGHQYMLMGLTPPASFLGMEMHTLGVRILFVVSGYLVSASFIRSKGVGEFLWKRISRLYPALLICLVLTVIVMRGITTIPQYYWQSGWQYLIHNLQMRPKFDLAGVFADNSYPVAVNGSLWTLPIEVTCYIMLIPVMLIYKVLSRYNKWYGSFLVMTILVLFTAVDCWNALYSGGAMLVFWDTNWLSAVSLGIWFFIGVLFQLLNLKKICNWQLGMLIAFVYFCLPPLLKYITTPYIISYLMFCFAFAEKPFFCAFFARDICYGLYLYAFPIQQLLISIIKIKFQMNCPVYVMLLLSIGMTWIMAEFNYFFVEKPLIRKGIGNVSFGKNVYSDPS